MSGVPVSTRLDGADREALFALAARRGERPGDTLRALVRGAVANPEATSRAADAVRLAAEARPARPARKRKPSGLQVSYRRAVEAVASELDRRGLVEPSGSGRLVAETWLRDALSSRQRDQLEARR